MPKFKKDFAATAIVNTNATTMTQIWSIKTWVIWICVAKSFEFKPDFAPGISAGVNFLLHPVFLQVDFR